MGENSAIEWTHHTFNPWWGCAHVSEGCANCYAERDARRYGSDVWGKIAPRRFFGDAHWAEPLRWNSEADRAGERRRVFCASMADVFEPRPDLDTPRRRLWDLIASTPWLDWLLLTKRPETVLGMVPWVDAWPPNVWVGTSVETQQWADRRIPRLLKIPARIRFLSVEPLLGSVRLIDGAFDYLGANGDRIAWNVGAGHAPDCDCYEYEGSGRNCPIEVQEALGRGVDWVICGGESGPKARPMHPDWALRIRDECAEAKVPFVFKQWGAWSPYAPLRDGTFDFRNAYSLADDGTLYEPGALAYPTELMAGHTGPLLPPGDARRYEYGPRYAEALRAHHDRAHLTAMYRVGKKAAGRLLDDRIYDEYPAPAVPATDLGRLL